MATVSVSNQDSVQAVISTWAELVSNPDRSYSTSAYLATDMRVDNLSSPERSYDVTAHLDTSIALSWVVDTTLEHWTTETLVQNSEFSDYKQQIGAQRNIPTFWSLQETFGSKLNIAADPSAFITSPNSVLFDYSGTGGKQRTVMLSQRIPLSKDIQTKGTYRLIFNYLTNDDGVEFFPFVRFLDSSGTILAQRTFLTAVVPDGNGEWGIYDQRVSFEQMSANAAFVELIIGVKRVKDGAFKVNLDSIDFHYSFNLQRIPAFPSTLTGKIASAFARTTLGKAVFATTRGGVSKRSGDISFAAIKKEQFEHLMAAWAFMAGHRLNVKAVIPHRAGVTLPDVFHFVWRSGFNWGPSVIQETLYDLSLSIEEI